MSRYATDQDPRMLLSCLRCKRRKQRCDKVLPTCSACQKLRIECVRAPKESHDRKRGNVTALLEYIASLEAELQARDSSATSASSRTEERSTTTAENDIAQPNGSHTNPAISISHLSLSAVAEPLSRAGEFLRHLSTPGLITAVTDTFGGDPERTAHVSPLFDAISQYIRTPSSSSQRLFIPATETQKALATYLDVVDFRYPRLAVEKVRLGMAAISNEEGEKAYNELNSSRPAHIFMAYIVVAIVPLVSDAYPVAQGSWVSAHLLSKCLKLLNRVFLQEDGVDIIQCLHLLIILSIHCSTAGSSWHLVGFAMNKAIALGYHHESSRGGLSDDEVQQRRWAFWGIYVLDRLICAGLGRPFSIRDSDISVPLPSEGTESCVQTRAYIHLFKYAILLSSVGKELNGSDEGNEPGPNFDEILGQALYWRTTSPARGQTGAVADIHAYQMSLHNTLLLRAAVREINHAFIVIAPCSDIDGEFHLRHKVYPEDAAPSLLRHERDHVDRINLLALCRAVAKSLDRSRMTSRPYLSFLTGYSSISLGLCCLYYTTLYSFAGHTDASDPVRPSRNGRTVHDDTEDRLYTDPHALIDLACRRLEVVGRQFPRLQEYRIILEKLRGLVRLWRTRWHPHESAGEHAPAMRDHVLEFRRSTEEIGPPHLRSLAEATLHLLCL